MNGEFSRFNHQSRPGKGNLKEKDRFSQAFSVLLNYWELKPAQYEAKLHELALKDVRVVSAFVPWAHVETDIYHSLRKFVRAAWAARLNVRLFVMPELGVNYPNAGFPKDLLGNISNLAVDRLGRVIYSHAAPNIFPLPSFSSPEVLKRFGNFLIKVGSILGEVFTETASSEFCEVVVSNTLFNYYRSHGMTLGEHGDYSAAHVMAFRDFLDREYPNANSETFKMQVYEGYNRHRFFTHIERLLREKTEMVFARKNTNVCLRHIDLFNPECEPDAAYQGLLTELFDFKPSIERYYEAIIAGGYRGEAIHLGDSGIFRRFSDQEKSFLMLAALIHSGEVAVMAGELFKLSPNFQRKLRQLVSFLEERRLVRQTRVTYVSASKFSMEDRSATMLSGMAPGVFSVVAGLDRASGHVPQHSERLVFMDPRSVIRLVELAQLLSSAQSGKVVAVPAPMSAVANYTTDAAAHLERFRKGRNPLRLNLGVSYEVYEYHLGQVVFYDPQPFWSAAAEAPAAELAAEPAVDSAGVKAPPEISRFFSALLGLAEVRSVCSVNDRRLHVASYVSEDDPSSRLLFLINPTSEDLEAKLTFSDVVTLDGIPAGEPAGGSGLPAAGAAGAAAGAEGATAPITGRTFELAVPHFGVLSMQVSEPGRSEIEPDAGGVLKWT